MRLTDFALVILCSTFGAVSAFSGGLFENRRILNETVTNSTEPTAAPTFSPSQSPSETRLPTSNPTKFPTPKPTTKVCSCGSAADLKGFLNPALLCEEIDCTNVGVSGSVVVANHTVLSKVNLGNNVIESLVVENCEKLTTLIAAKNRISNLEVYSAPVLKRLDIQSNRLNSWTLTGAKNILYMNAANNELKRLPRFPSYAVCLNLTLSQNSITELDLKAFHSLQKLDASENDLETLDLQLVETLVELDLQLNRNLKTIYFNNPLLQHVEIRRCNIESLDLSTLALMEYLSCSTNAMKSLNLKSNLKLKEVYALNNYLETLDLTGHGANLKVLQLQNNLLKSLGDISGLTELTSLKIDGNCFTEEVCPPEETKLECYLPWSNSLCPNTITPSKAYRLPRALSLGLSLVLLCLNR